MEKWELKDCRKRGRIERVDYQAECKDGTMVDKYANVYVPYGYDASKKYNILYVMHGEAAPRMPGWIRDRSKTFSTI